MRTQVPIHPCWKIQIPVVSKANHLSLQTVLLVTPSWNFFFWLPSMEVLLFFDHIFAISSLVTLNGH